jgi:calmodulin
VFAFEKKFSSGGKIGPKEIGTASRAAGLNPSEADLDLWKAESDVKSGLDKEGFKKWMGRKFDETNDSQEEIVDSFRAFDTSGSGMITVSELKHILTNMGEKMKDDEVQVLIDELDIEGGKVNYNAIAAMLFPQA